MRSLKTSFSREFFKKEYDSSITDEQLEDFGTGALRLAAVNGDEEKAVFIRADSSMVKQEQNLCTNYNRDV